MVDHLTLSEDQISRYKRLASVSKVSLDLIFTTLTSNPNISTYDTSKEDFSTSKMSQSRSFMNSSVMSGYVTTDPDQPHVKSKMDFEHFQKFLEMIAKKVLPNIPVSKAFVYLLADFILPLLHEKKNQESRCV